ncbi:MAG: FISUMP domain-containing protein [Bacteroidales bacterium]
MKKLFLSIILLISITRLPIAQNHIPQVINPRFEQRMDGSFKIDIYFDLLDEDDNVMEVSIQVSNDAGTTWDYSFDPSNLTGNIGSNQVSGTNKVITWDFALDHPETFVPELQFKIIADDGVISMGQPCPNYPSFSYSGELYNTVLIGSQCWMKENLNIGLVIYSSEEPTNDNIVEKYCMLNNLDNCQSFGGLYSWDEMMGYTENEGAQGICPCGWHIPTNTEFCTLLKYLDSTYDCNCTNLSGINVGAMMKETGLVHWHEPNLASNLSGFSGIGGGELDFGMFFNFKSSGTYWTSTESFDGHYVNIKLFNSEARAMQGYEPGDVGFSVRCIKNSLSYPPQSDAGEDQYIYDNSTYLQGNSFCQPETGAWSIISGSSGDIIDPNNPTSQFIGILGDTYILVWTISGNEYTTSDTVVISFVFGNPCEESPIVEYLGETYHTVKIGSQCWMRENLNVGNQVISTLTDNPHSDMSNNNIIEKYCYNNLPENCEIYGGLYDWYELMNYTPESGAQGICPQGWHIPSLNELFELGNYLGGYDIAGGKMKESNYLHWNSPNLGATNESGYYGLGGGGRSHFGEFINLMNDAKFALSSLQHGFYELNTNYAGLAFGYAFYDIGTSVRCIKGICPPTTPSNAGIDQGVSGTSVTLNANTPIDGETGTWTVTQGPGNYQFSDINDPHSIFYGIIDCVYQLCWKIENICSNSTDTVVIHFCPTLTQANAGPDQLNLEIDTTILYGNNYIYPIGENGQWTIVQGIGGTIFNPTNPITSFTGNQGVQYVLRWTISNGCISSWDELTVIFGQLPLGSPCLEQPIVVYGNQNYNTIQIGSQCWFRENLNIGTIINYENEQTNNTIIEKYCLGNNMYYCSIFGGFYQWDEMMQYSTIPGSQGICPVGWHIPTIYDWCTLLMFLDNTASCNEYYFSENSAGGKMKDTVTGVTIGKWLPPNTGATNESNFSAKSGGYRHPDGYTNGIGQGTGFWTSSIDLNTSFDPYIGIYIFYNSAKLFYYNKSKFYGLQVRCIKD